MQELITKVMFLHLKVSDTFLYTTGESGPC